MYKKLILSALLLYVTPTLHASELADQPISQVMSGDLQPPIVNYYEPAKKINSEDLTADNISNFQNAAVVIRLHNKLDEKLALINQLKTSTVYLEFDCEYGTITKAELESLAQVSNLRGIDFFDCGLTDGDMEYLKPLEGLRLLSLTCNEKITSNGLQHISGLTNLIFLSLDGVYVKDEGIKVLLGLTKLKHFDLSETGVRDASLEVVAGFNDLEVLDVSYNSPDDGQVGGITDNGLVYLNGLKKLRKLCLDGNDGITFKGLSEIYIAHPGLETEVSV